MKRVPEDSLDYPGDGYYYLDDEPFTGIAFTLHDDGSLESETEYKYGLKCGLERHWFGPDALEYEAELQRGVVHGKKRVWYSNGTLMEEGDYEHGIALRSKTWDEDGKLVEDVELQETDSNFALLQRFREIEKKRSGNTTRSH
jgi:antitoxin component YwqK of YwqJK toxin-antitoxin module